MDYTQTAQQDLIPDQTALPPQPVIEKKPFPLKKIIIPIVIFTLLAGLIGAYFFFNFQNTKLTNVEKNTNEIQQETTSHTDQQTETAIAESTLAPSPSSDNWQYLNVESAVDYQKGYELFYPPTWTLDMTRSEEGLPSVNLKTNKNSTISILQGAMGAGGCLYPGDDPLEGMWSRYDVYTEFSKDGVEWRVAKLLDTDENIFVVCEKRENQQFAGLTSIGVITLKTQTLDSDAQLDFLNIVDRIIINGARSQSGESMVTGKVCYPSEIVPAGKIVAKNIETQAIITKNNLQGYQSFTLALDPGTYVFAYLMNGQNPSEESYDGFYTPCAKTMNYTDCDETSEHQLIQVKVLPGQVQDGVALCDWYWQPENKPLF